MKRLALLMASYFLVFQSHIYPANAVDIPVLCADSQSFALRPSNVMKGCQQNELSLGEGPIAYSLTAEKKLNPILEVRFKAAQAAAKSEGINLKIVSGYRTFARQQYLFDQAVKSTGAIKRQVNGLLRQNSLIIHWDWLSMLTIPMSQILHIG